MFLQRGANRIFATNGAATVIAEITFPQVAPGIVEIDHTFVDDCLRGQGAASKLVEAAAKQIEEEGMKARVTCSYAVKWFEKHEEYKRIVTE